MTRKPKILLCWGYNRKNWIEYFEALNGEFEFVYLFYMYPQEETEVYTENKRIFYTDFKSPKHLLGSIKPEKIVFMGLDGLQTIALNVQAKKMGIQTFFMTHGSATLSLDDYRDFKFGERNLFKESLTHKLGSWLFTFRFLLSALGIKYISSLPKLLQFQVDRLKMHPLLAMQKNKTRLRVPDKYIVFSREDVKFCMDVDDCSEKDIIILGNLEITSAIKMANDNGVHNNGYLLYVETPLSVIEGNQFDINKLTKEEVNGIITSMNEYALQRGLRLIIKLHPYSFNTTFFLEHPNITYERSSAKDSLILGADAIIFYNSSLAIPALFFKPCCMFIIGKPDEFQSTLSSLNICTVVDYKEIIKNPECISFFTPAEEARNAFIDKYIGAGADGKGLERLRDTLYY